MFFLLLKQILISLIVCLSQIIYIKMQDAAQRLINYPIQYIAQVRKLSFSQTFLIGTRASVGYVCMLILSFVSMLALGGFQIYWVFTHEIQECYNSITWGIYVLSILYVLQSILVCIFLISLVGQTSSWCLRSIVIIFFGLVQIGSCYGGIGSVWLCFLESQNSLYINKGLFVKNYFIHTIVYIYIAFLITYIIITPILTVLYIRRDANNNEMMDRSCADYICCIFFYFSQLLMLICFLCLLLIKILGPILFLYVLVEIGKVIYYSQFDYLAIFIIGILGIFLPLIVFLILLLIKSLCCSSSHKELQQDKSQQLQKMQSTNRQKTPDTISDNKSHQSSLLSKRSTPSKLPDDKYALNNSRL